jgi:uncharacterized protein
MSFAPAIHGSTLHPGDASGAVIRLDQPLSLWGVIDVATGEIADARHPQHGLSITGRVLVMSSGRGSSSSSSVLAEMIRNRVAPAAIVLEQTDGILTIGAMVARVLYGIAMPIVIAPEIDHAWLADGTLVHVSATDAQAAITTLKR